MRYSATSMASWNRRGWTGLCENDEEPVELAGDTAKIRTEYDAGGEGETIVRYGRKGS